MARLHKHKLRLRCRRRNANRFIGVGFFYGYKMKPEPNPVNPLPQIIISVRYSRAMIWGCSVHPKKTLPANKHRMRQDKNQQISPPQACGGEKARGPVSGKTMDQTMESTVPKRTRPGPYDGPYVHSIPDWPLCENASCASIYLC